MSVNKHIIAAALIITGTGLYNAIAKHNTSVTRVIIGGYVFLLITSILDYFGGPLDTIASAMAMLAVLYVVLRVWQQIGIWSDIGKMLGVNMG